MASKEVLRLEMLKNHLTSNFDFRQKDNSLDKWRVRGKNFDVNELRRLMLSPGYDLYNEIANDVKGNPLFNQSLDRLADRTKMQEIAHFRNLYLHSKYPPHEDQQSRIIQDKSIANRVLGQMKIGTPARLAGMGLTYDAIRFLGTEKHQKYMNRPMRLEDMLAFCMTELGHGSNVSAIETEAVYDHENRQFVINSPTPTSIKFWPGSLAKTGNIGIFYARLFVKEQDCGVHPFIIPIRDWRSMKALPGRLIGSLGQKSSFNTVDNGFIKFTNVKIPYDNMLDRLSQITSEGEFVSQIKDNKDRLSTMLMAFTPARIGMVAVGPMLLHPIVQIAIRYQAVRKQFSVDGGMETSVLEYPVQKFKLMSILSKLFATTFSVFEIIELSNFVIPKMEETFDFEEIGELHAIISVMKPLSLYYAEEGAQKVREACGAFGYSMLSQLDDLRSMAQISFQLDGDSNVIYQQTVGFLMKAIQQKFKGREPTLQSLKFLNVEQSYLEQQIQFQDVTNLSFELLIELLELITNKYLQLGGQYFIENMQDNDGWDRALMNGLKQGAYAFGEVFIAKSSIKYANQVKDEELRNLVSQIIRLYILQCIEKHSDLLLTYYLNFDMIRQIRRQIQDLCAELTESAVRIIDAIEIPDHLIDSPLAKSDGQVYKNFAEMLESMPGTYEQKKWPLIYLLHRISHFN